jgi:hypothetical protein
MDVIYSIYNKCTAGVYQRMEDPGMESWGGEKCKNYVPFEVHAFEATFWCIFLMCSYTFFDITKIREEVCFKSELESKSLVKKAVFRNILAIMHVIIIIHLFWCKWLSNTILYLLQPCHLILIFQGIALISEPVLSAEIALYTVPAQVGALLALVFPDTSGLILPFETEAYWIQHVLITTITPIYLLSYNNTYKLLNMKSIIVGTWMVAELHWGILEGLDYFSTINIDFMLCPTPAMLGAFNAVPSYLLKPLGGSYRSTMCLVVILFGIPLSYLHKSIASILTYPSTNNNVKSKEQ